MIVIERGGGAGLNYCQFGSSSNLVESTFTGNSTSGLVVIKFPVCYLFYIVFTIQHYVKGIFQPFELGGVTRLIRSAVKFWKAGN